MTENRFAHGASAGAAGDDFAPLLFHPGTAAPQPAAEAEPDEHAFASDEEEDAYWAGVADGIRHGGGTVPPRLAARAAGQQLLVEAVGEEQGPPPAPPRNRGGEPHSDSPPAIAGGAGGGSSCVPGQDPDDILHFTTAHLRARHDGWTPEKQREFVEALADTGVVRAAAARVGMTEQSVNRLRRRANARGFDRACEAALRLGGRRLVSIAYERAIEGSIKRHYFHGELKAEERVHDNRLLIALINKLPADALAPTPQTQEVAANWEPWMEAIEQGREPPAAPAPGSERSEADGPFEARVWEDEGGLFTDAPPPEGFDLYENGAPGGRFYERELTEAEEEYWEEEGEDLAELEEGWDRVIYHLGRPTFFPLGSEPFEPCAAAAEPEGERSEANSPSGESRPSPADGSAALADEPDRRRGLAATPAAAERQGERSEANSPSGESRPGAADGSSAPADEPDRGHGFAGTPAAAEPEGERSEANSPSGESRPGPADGSAAPADEPDRRHGFAGTEQAPTLQKEKT